MFYLSTILWLRLQQESKWVKINFERKALTSPQESHPSLDGFGEAFAFNLRKQNITHVSFMSLTQNFCSAPEKVLLL